MDLKSRVKKTSLYKGVERRRTINEYWRWSDKQRESACFYSGFIRPGDLVFDVGANLGVKTRVFLELGAKVVGFEPQQKCVEYLELVLENRNEFTLESLALGSNYSKRKMHISDAHYLSSLSEVWINATKNSGRFKYVEWAESREVQTDTLDSFIKKYGVPEFIKIDVEGYELEVLKGLSSPVSCISIEFTAETIEQTIKCIDHVSHLSALSCQFVKADNSFFELSSWVDSEDIGRFLEKLRASDPLCWGDVYMRNH